MNRRSKQGQIILSLAGHKEFYSYSQNWLSKKILFQTAWVDRLPSCKSIYSFSYVFTGTDTHWGIYSAKYRFPTNTGNFWVPDFMWYSFSFLKIFFFIVWIVHTNNREISNMHSWKWAIVLFDQDCQTYAKWKKEWFMKKSLLLNFIKKSKMTYTIFCLHWIWMIKKAFKNLECPEHNQQNSLICTK